MSVTYIVDADGWFRVVSLPSGQSPATLKLEDGARFASNDEIESEMYLREARRVWRRADGRHPCGSNPHASGPRAHGALAHEAEAPIAAYALAAEIAERRPFTLTIADLESINVAVAGRQPGGQSRRGYVHPLGPYHLTRCVRCGLIDVQHELREMLARVATLIADGNALGAAAYTTWRTVWIHPFNDGNGRSSRAACYAILLAGVPGLRRAHARRTGATGRDVLTVPERIEQCRDEYLSALNEAHAVAAAGPVYAATVDLTRLERFIAGLVDHQLAGCVSQPDPWEA